MLKKTLFLVALLFVIMGVAVSAETANSGTCGDGLTWKYEDYVLTISGTGSMYDYKSDYKNNYRTTAPWNIYSDIIKKVVIDDGVTSIGNSAFLRFYDLTEITIPESVTHIGESAFSMCDSLSEMIIPDSVTLLGESAFSQCVNLKRVVLSDNVTVIEGSTLGYCYALESVELGSKVTDIKSQAFYGCRALKSIVMPDTVKSIGGYAFDGCVLLSDIKLSCNLESIGNYAFSECKSLTSIKLPETLTTITDYVFADSTALEEVYLPDSLTTVGKMLFIRCTSLKNVHLPANLRQITYAMFYECSGLTEIEIPETVTSIEPEAFVNCSSLKELYISKSLTQLSLNSFVGCRTLKHFTVEKGNANYVSIDGILFTKDQTKLLIYPAGKTEKSYAVPDSVTELATYSFYYAVSLNSVILPDTLSVINGYAFKYATGLKSIVIPDSVTIMSNNVFEGCSSLESITLSRSIDEVATGAFSYCRSLKEVEIPDNITIIDDRAFANCRSLSLITLPNSVKSFGVSVFNNSPVTIRCYQNSYAHSYAIDHNIDYVLMSPMAYITTDGVRITLHELYDIKDFYIAKGEYQTYREIKDNGYIFSAGSAKIGGKHDYTYTVREPGMHTVFIRYNDGTTALFHEELTVDEPVMTANGLQVTISNIPDVKVIRTAYGEWDSVRELKATDSIRNFSANTAIKGSDPYKIQYRKEGTVTIIVEYNNGYVKVFHYEVQQKTPTVEQNGNCVIFGDLYGLNVLRYAKGEYTTSKQIKNAQDSKYFKPADIIDGAIVVTLESGTYTFCVQYDDESYNYYTIVVE